jgi:phosphoribulokinase
MVVPGGKMELAMQLVLSPIMLDLMEKKWKRSSK